MFCDSVMADGTPTTDPKITSIEKAPWTGEIIEEYSILKCGPLIVPQFCPQKIERIGGL